MVLIWGNVKISICSEFSLTGFCTEIWQGESTWKKPCAHFTSMLIVLASLLPCIHLEALPSPPRLAQTFPGVCSPWYMFCPVVVGFLWGHTALAFQLECFALICSGMLASDMLLALSVDKKWHVKSSHLRRCVLSFWGHDEVHDPKKLKEERVYFSLQF